MVDPNAMAADEAVLNITWSGENGDLPDAILYDTSEAEIKRNATEAVRTGGVPGIDLDETVDFADFVVTRFRAKDDVPFNRVVLRPKTPFGPL